MKTITNNLIKLIHILNDQSYHSGTSLGIQFGLTRSGVWKLIKQLQALGIEIESATNNGYRLLTPIDFLNEKQIKKYIQTNQRRFLDEIFIFDDIASTNDYLIIQAKSAPKKNLACLAERQTAGRGRLGREWVSPFAANIYLSLLWHFKRDITELAGLNIAIGVSVVEALQTIADSADIKLKWPNDIFYQERKLGGILIDLTGEGSGGCNAVIGIGINVNMPKKFVNRLQKPWIDLQHIISKPILRNQIAGLLLDKLIANLIKFQTEGLTDLIKKWHTLDCMLGKEMLVQSANQSIKGIGKGINQQGYLLIKTENGTIHTISTGDVCQVRSSY